MSPNETSLTFTRRISLARSPVVTDTRYIRRLTAEQSSTIHLKKAKVIEEFHPAPTTCSACGIGRMHVTTIADSRGRVVYHRPLPTHWIDYLDSGGRPQQASLNS